MTSNPQPDGAARRRLRQWEMANETKVGLLVGLSFIVCFAVILSNRGSSQTPPILGRNNAARAVQHNSVSPTSLAQKARSASRGADVAPSQNEAGPSPAVHTAPVRETPASEKAPLENQRDAPPASAFEKIEEELRTSPQPKPSGKAFAEGRRDLSDWTLDPGAAVVKEEPEPVVLAGKGREGASDQADGATLEPTSEGRQHVVQKGETLYKIARDVYGSSAPQVVNHIFEVNRATLKSQNSLNVGDKIMLPEMPKLSDFPPATKKEEPAKVEKKLDKPRKPEAVERVQAKPKGKKAKDEGQSQKPQWKWYQVGEGDRFASIADKQMGNSKHWKQLADFNKDIFPDPAKIRPGVRIRIPAEKLAKAD